MSRARADGNNRYEDSEPEEAGGAAETDEDDDDLEEQDEEEGDGKHFSPFVLIYTHHDDPCVGCINAYSLDVCWLQRTQIPSVWTRTELTSIKKHQPPQSLQ